ncbi:hypothetical protein GI584_11590 [Gracilibacillus salitolerans]|uniref:Uncharacterized protein n=1 Tax=Gracilibacillus salitolerans TaxID=2663022 RepID=A0A5Q2TIB5_9BACI|nr:CBO0543 family protein [Gracilibacillus salitolerans]QGH34634.1 hypothetical protein GI584_11590 [Gracilibacillus salitolerans]
MHLAIALWVLVASIIRGDWENINKYYPTMLYITSCNFLYEVIAHEKFYLWKLEPGGLNYLNTVLLHGGFIYPLSVLLFLSNYPTSRVRTVMHISKWVLIYIIVEYIGLKYEIITYHNGWNFWWSFFFVIHMLLMLRIHYINIIWGITLTIPSVLFYMFTFNYF